MQQVITGIEQQKKNPDRVNIFLEEEFAFGLYKYVAFSLRVGDILDDKAIRKLKAEDTLEDAFQKALHLLSFRARTEHEIRVRLAKYEFDEDVIDMVIQRMVERDYLNDQRFAEEWVENRTTFRPRGRRLLQRELQQKRVNEAKIQQALESLPSEAELALQAAQKHVSKIKANDRNTFQRKLYAYLARRGFLYEDIKPVINELWEDRESSNLEENEVLENEW